MIQSQVNLIYGINKAWGSRQQNLSPGGPHLCLHLSPGSLLLQPQPLAPIQGLALGLELQKNFGNAFGCPSRAPSCRLGSPAPLAKPLMSCPRFISQEAQHFFSNGMVFLELVSKAALRGTADAASA